MSTSSTRRLVLLLMAITALAPVQGILAAWSQGLTHSGRYMHMSAAQQQGPQMVSGAPVQECAVHQTQRCKHPQGCVLDCHTGCTDLASLFIPATAGGARAMAAFSRSEISFPPSTHCFRHDRPPRVSA